jgi:hypothetical protein
MDKDDKMELMICIVASFIDHNGSLSDALMDAIQDCGFTDRDIMDISRAGVNLNRERNGKS